MIAILCWLIAWLLEGNLGGLVTSIGPEPATVADEDWWTAHAP
jgi:hypothetical protein